jgi:hypothetical protein
MICDNLSVPYRFCDNQRSTAVPLHNDSENAYVCVYEQNRYNLWDKSLYRKCKAIAVTGHGGLQNSETSRIPHFVDIRLTDDSKDVILKSRPHMPPGRYPARISVRG